MFKVEHAGNAIHVCWVRTLSVLHVTSYEGHQTIWYRQILLLLFYVIIIIIIILCYYYYEL